MFIGTGKSTLKHSCMVGLLHSQHVPCTVWVNSAACGHQLIVVQKAQLLLLFIIISAYPYPYPYPGRVSL